MRFKAFTVSQADFESWAAHQLQPGEGAPAAVAPGAPAVGTAPAVATAAPGQVAATTPVVQAGFIAFPREKLPAHTVPQTPLPRDLAFDDNTLANGNAANGKKLVTSGMCIACHAVRGEPTMMGNIGPNLTHIGSRTTFGGGLYPTEAKNLARWIKHSAKLKPGSLMNSFGIGEYDPITKSTVKIGYTDPQIADIVAYLISLK
jgi:cytochrome c oxidase subunit 2